MDFTLPSLGADMDEGALVAWLVEPGDEVARGQIVAEVETDKGIIEIECWEDVVVDELLVRPSEERLAVGTVIARFRTMGEAPEPEAADDSSDPQAESEPDVDRSRTERHRTTRVTPPVRHLAHELGVDLERVQPTGPGGAVTRDDVRRVGQRHDTRRAKASPRARKFAERAGVDLADVSPGRTDGYIVSADVESVAPAERETVTPAAEAKPLDKAEAMRAAIARSVERSKREIPHYYLATTIDMAIALDWLEATNEDRPITERILPAVMLLKATASALREFPELNGHWIDGAFQASESVHLGVAISLRGGGLVAPAIHDADRLDLGEMMAALSDLVTRARAGRLRGSEMTEATATVTNLGDRGVEVTYPVIVPPQVAIIGFGRIGEEPVVHDGALTVRPVVHATLAADHRVTDGHAGGLFLLAVKRLLEKPEDL